MFLNNVFNPGVYTTEGIENKYNFNKIFVKAERVRCHKINLENKGQTRGGDNGSCPI